ncbi:MAG: RnfABCDGE type electron transport complex subunit D [Phycisphaerales bacterium]|nr:MAG: RnfABCDGE type electron transport complex subunit D [Phycisphaerales bacterium]
MSDAGPPMLPLTPTRWPADSAPFLRPAPSSGSLAWLTSAAALPVAAAGVVLFGRHGAIIMALSVATALLTNAILGYLTRRGGVIGTGHAVMTGLLLALTLPPHVDWGIPVVGALIAILVGKGLLGGYGNYLWSPVLVGRVGLQVLDPAAMLPASWPVLGRGRLLVGDLSNATDSSPFFAWRNANLPDGVDSWLLPRLDSLLAGTHDGLIHSGPPALRGERITSLADLLNDVLPPWGETLLGTVGGGFGETCALCIIVGGLYLIHRGLVRWQLPVALLLGAAVTAAVFPIASSWNEQGEVIGRMWLPGLTLEGHKPLGLVYVLYHLTTGELLLAAFFIATDIVSSPMRGRGQVVFGFGVGVLTICLRMLGIIPGAAYWAILILNPFVSLIDRLTRRRVFGV